MPAPQSSIPQGLREVQHASIALTNLLLVSSALTHRIFFHGSMLWVLVLHALVEMCNSRGHMNFLDENLCFERDVFFCMYIDIRACACTI